MSAPPRRYRRLVDLALGGSRRADVEMDREIESHIAMRVADLVRAGLSEDEARAEALRRFGDLDDARRRLHSAARQRHAAIHHRQWANALGTDVRYAFRRALAAPRASALVIATLAIGIGATTAMFTLVDHILLRPLPFADAGRLVSLSGMDSAHDPVMTVSSADWLDWRAAKGLTTALYGFTYRQPIFTTDSAVRVNAVRVSGNYFEVLRPRFVAGRPFTDEEVRSGANVAVVSERLWREMFDGTPRLGMPLRTQRTTFTVIGVTASATAFPQPVDVWLPVPITLATDRSRININWFAIGRLAPSATVDRATAELSAVARRIRVADPGALYDYGVTAVPLATAVAGDSADYLKMLMGVVVLVLAIVCANVAAAGLARGAGRVREIAIRRALGANPWRVIRLVLVEHLVLGAVGGITGIGLAWVAVRTIVARWGPQIPRANEVALDDRVLLFSIATTLLAGMLAGILPALRTVRAGSFLPAFAAGGRTSARGGRGLPGAWLIGGEIALALLLSTGAGLLIHSFRVLLDRGVGLDTNVATVSAALGGAGYAGDEARRAEYWTSLVAAYRAAPGIRAVGLTSNVPLGITGRGFIDVDSRDVPGAGAVYRVVNGGFFDALKIPLVAGRSFGAEDGPGTAHVAIVNRRMASMYWPGESPVGKQVRARSMEESAGHPAAWLTIVGVVGDIRTYGLESDIQPEMYTLYTQVPTWTTAMTVLVRPTASAASLGPELRQRARTVDAGIAVDVGTIDALLQSTLASRVLTMLLLSAFAAVAVALAAIGIYGTLSYAVAQRTRELAVRAALGASRGQLFGLILRAGLIVVAAGTACGLAAAVLLTRTMTAMLVEVGPADPLAFGVAFAVLVLSALAAIVGPAIRATRLPPAIALQAE